MDFRSYRNGRRNPRPRRMFFCPWTHLDSAFARAAVDWRGPARHSQAFSETANGYFRGRFSCGHRVQRHQRHRGCVVGCAGPVARCAHLSVARRKVSRTGSRVCRLPQRRSTGEFGRSFALAACVLGSGPDCAHRERLFRTGWRRSIGYARRLSPPGPSKKSRRIYCSEV